MNHLKRQASEDLLPTRAIKVRIASSDDSILSRTWTALSSPALTVVKFFTANVVAFVEGLSRSSPIIGMLFMRCLQLLPRTLETPLLRLRQDVVLFLRAPRYQASSETNLFDLFPHLPDEGAPCLHLRRFPPYQTSTQHQMAKA